MQIAYIGVHDLGCLGVSGGLEVSGGPAQLLRASRHDLGCLEVSGDAWRCLEALRNS